MEEYTYKKKKDEVEEIEEKIEKKIDKPKLKKVSLELRSGDNVVKINDTATNIHPAPFFNQGVHWIPVEPLMEFLKDFVNVSFDDKTKILKIGGK